MLDRLSYNFLRIPRSTFEQFLGWGVSFNKVFHFSEKHFHKNGLRTNPAAKQSAESSGEQNNEYNESDHRESEDEEILWPENLAKQDKLRFRNVEEEEWPSLYSDKRQCEKKYKEAPAYPGPDTVKPSFGFLGEDPFAFAFFVDSCYTVAE